MVFSSFVFLFYFLPLTLVAYFSSNNRAWRNVVLLITSLFFYSWGEPHYVVLMIASITLNWFLALLIARRTNYSVVILVFGVVINLFGIALFKYGNFFVENAGNAFGFQLRLAHIYLPIGISFYTFQAISYLVDVYRDNITPQKNPVFFGAYLSMFPQLIAGPIVRYETIEQELLSRRENMGDISDGLRRFIIGFCKKIFIANTMGVIADTILRAEPSTVGAIPAWYGFVAYTFQIYFDFSGYSDMAIGLGRMFGFHFLENFNYPYISRSVTEFWRRWHISLSTFFRDYVYIPLGGNQVTTSRWLINILIVWSLTGLWHGASWNFMCWGLYYGILLAGERKLWGGLLSALPRLFQHFYTIFIFVFGWIIFRIESFRDIGRWVMTILGFYGPGKVSTLEIMNILQYYPWFIVASIASTPIVAKLLQRRRKSLVGGYVYDFCSACLFFIALTKLATGAFNPFIYFRF